MKSFNKIIKPLKLILTVPLLSVLLSIQTANAVVGGVAQSNTDRLLTFIANTTYEILSKVNQMPAYIGSLTEMALSWISTTDSANTIANNQYGFALSTSDYNTRLGNQIDFTKTLTKQYLLGGSFKPDRPSLPSNANDLIYSILIGQPIIPGTSSQDYDANARNYIANITGTTFSLPQPDPNWKESLAKQNYVHFYNTLAAIQSYNTYTVSHLYHPQEGAAASNYLVTQASSSDWFTHVASEPLGLVLRHILMYSSQSYVELNRLVEIQQQQLSAQAMTNTLLAILNAQLVGPGLAQRAMQAGR